jgi:hypothetical protein
MNTKDQEGDLHKEGAQIKFYLFITWAQENSACQVKEQQGKEEKNIWTSIDI